MANVTPITAARRHVQWSDTRWAWKRGVRQDASLPDAAKVLAAALCDDWANHESGFCNPSVATLAKSLGKAERSIQRAIAALKAAGWLDTVVRGRGDRGGNGKGDQGSEFVFLMAQPKGPETVSEAAGNDAEKVTQLAPFMEKGDTQRVTLVTVKGDKRVIPPCTPYKDKPTLNQGARGHVAPPCKSMHPISINSAGAESWDAWLQRRGHPPIEALAECGNYAGEPVWLLPIRSPPMTGNRIEEAIVQRWIEERRKVR